MQRPRRFVRVAPDRWRADASMREDERDLFRERWAAARRYDRTIGSQGSPGRGRGRNLAAARPWGVRPLGARAGRLGLPGRPAVAAAAAVLLAAAGSFAGDRAPVDRYAERRLAMVEEQIAARGVAQPEVLEAMRRVPRHFFVPEALRGQAYDDRPLPIGHGQTISQPYIVALMTELLDLDRQSRVLEIGTGSGYHAAVLSEVAGEVYSIEIVEPLAGRARSLLAEQGYANVEVRVGDGYRGWPEARPFDGIILTAAPREIPQPLVEQLAIGGKMVLPLGGDWVQDLLVVTKTPDGEERRRVAAVRFVPMTGEAQEQEEER